MKLFELKANHDGITIRREAEERLTGEQKFYITMTAIISAAAISFCYIMFYLVLKA